MACDQCKIDLVRSHCQRTDDLLYLIPAYELSDEFGTVCIPHVHRLILGCTQHISMPICLKHIELIGGSTLFVFCGLYHPRFFAVFIEAMKTRLVGDNESIIKSFHLLHKVCIIWGEKEFSLEGERQSA
jgi:hypothetical protein